MPQFSALDNQEHISPIPQAPFVELEVGLNLGLRFLSYGNAKYALWIKTHFAVARAFAFSTIKTHSAVTHAFAGRR